MLQQNCIDTIPSRDALRPARSMVWLSRLLLWLERARQRRDSRLDDRMLRDIGVGRGAAWAESRKHFWQV